MFPFIKKHKFAIAGLLFSASSALIALFTFLNKSSLELEVSIYNFQSYPIEYIEEYKGVGKNLDKISEGINKIIENTDYKSENYKLLSEIITNIRTIDSDYRELLYLSKNNSTYIRGKIINTGKKASEKGRLHFSDARNTIIQTKEETTLYKNKSTITLPEIAVKEEVTFYSWGNSINNDEITIADDSGKGTVTIHRVTEFWFTTFIQNNPFISYIVSIFFVFFSVIGFVSLFGHSDTKKNNKREKVIRKPLKK